MFSDRVIRFLLVENPLQTYWNIRLNEQTPFLYISKISFFILVKETTFFFAFATKSYTKYFRSLPTRTPLSEQNFIQERTWKWIEYSYTRERRNNEIPTTYSYKDNSIDGTDRKNITIGYVGNFPYVDYASNAHATTATLMFYKRHM